MNSTLGVKIRSKLRSFAVRL